jgi:hypothetical protein
MFEDERLDLGLCRLDRRAVGRPPRAPVIGSGGSGGFEKSLDQRGNQVAADDRVRFDPFADKMGLNRGIDDLGEFAAA